METLRHATFERASAIERYRRNRNRSHELFGRIAASAYEDRAILLRHPPVFYDGHIPAFSFNTLVRGALQRPSIDRTLEELFERGIDPDNLAAATAHSRSSWPSRSDVRRFGDACDQAVLDGLAHADLERSDIPTLERAQAAYTILEHEEMHHETFAYIVHRMQPSARIAPPGYAPFLDRPYPGRTAVTVAAGAATLGARRDAIAFGWDNEFEETVASVNAFECDVHPVTNGEWLDYVHAGGPVPSFWIESSREFRLRVLFGEIALPLSWPVFVTYDQAATYARAKGRRVMSEPEFHRAAYGTPDGVERAQPWGDDAPSALLGNFDWRRYDPEPVGSSPRGASAWGIQELIGNGWEHTATPFAPLLGFAPMESYPPYSSDFFDGVHNVVKGASPVTAHELVRRSLRNWYRTDYPYVYAKFRTVAS